MVRPMSLNRSRVMPCTNTTGKNTHTVVSVEAINAPEICLTPSTQARSTGTPSSLCRR